MTLTLPCSAAPADLDYGFYAGDGFDNAVYAIVLQPDHKILVGGGFSSFDSSNNFKVVRLEPDGTLDTGFSTRDRSKR